MTDLSQVPTDPKVIIMNLENQLSYANCEKLALDKAYMEQLHVSHKMRTQVELLSVEKAILEQRVMSCDHEIQGLKRQIEELKLKVNSLPAEDKNESDAA